MANPVHKEFVLELKQETMSEKYRDRGTHAHSRLSHFSHQAAALAQARSIGLDLKTNGEEEGGGFDFDFY